MLEFVEPGAGPCAAVNCHERYNQKLWVTKTGCCHYLLTFITRWIFGTITTTAPDRLKRVAYLGR